MATVKFYNTNPVVTSYTDYYPFGYPMPGRNWNGTDYRFGFNGQEKDNEIYGEGKSYTAEFWQYDSRLGRRWNLDPLGKPWESSYATFADSPIMLIDQSGLDTILPNAKGKGLYLPDIVSDIKYYTSDKAIGQTTGKEYSITKGGIESFSIDDKKYSATFNSETFEFLGYKTLEGELYNPDDYLPDLVKQIAFKNNTTPDLISFSANLATAMVLSVNANWAINRLNNGNDISWFYTKNEALGWGFGVDWGINITELYYVGPKPLCMVTSDDVLGDFSSLSLNFIYGRGNYKGYDKAGNIIWKGVSTGFGFGFGWLFEQGTTYNDR